MSHRLQKRIPTHPARASKPSGTTAWIAWALMSVVAVMSFVPLGFTIWWIAAPLLPLAFILTLQLLARGGMVQGLFLMACHVLVIPPVMAFGPLSVSAAATLPVAPLHLTPAGNSKDGSPSQLSPKLVELKEKLTRQRPEVARWLAEKLAVEQESGYLSTNSERDVDIQTRRAIQQENLWREAVFAEISRITGRPVEEIAAAYARLAAKKQ